MNNLQTAKKNKSIIVMFRSLFDKYLKIKYRFYAELFENDQIQKKVEVNDYDDYLNLMIGQQ